MAKAVGEARGASPLVATPKLGAYERLKSAILSGEIAPGSPLVEASLATMLEVSRTPVREALTRLEQDGLLDRDKSGLIVKERSPGEILDIYDVRILLESAVAQFAAERRTSHDITQMKLVQRQWSAVETSDARAMVDANRAFHQAVWRASHNDSLTDVLARLDLHIARFQATTLGAPHRWDEAGEEHAALIDAIEQRDVETASRLARDHFLAARAIRLRLWEEA